MLPPFGTRLFSPLPLPTTKRRIGRIGSEPVLLQFLAPTHLGLFSSVNGRNPFRTTLKTMGSHCLLVFTGESSFQGFLGGAGFRPSTVFLVETLGSHCKFLLSSRSLTSYCWMDESLHAPPKKPWNNSIHQRKYKQHNSFIPTKRRVFGRGKLHCLS